MNSWFGKISTLDQGRTKLTVEVLLGRFWAFCWDPLCLVCHESSLLHMMCSIDSQKTIQNCRFAFYKLSVDSKSTCSFWNHLVVRNFSNPYFVWCFKATFQWLKTSSLRTCRVGRMMSLGVSLWKCRPVIFGRSPFVRRNGPHQRSAFLYAEKHGGAIHFQRSNTEGTQMM